MTGNTDSNFAVKKGSAECKENLHEKVTRRSRSPGEVKEHPHQKFLRPFWRLSRCRLASQWKAWAKCLVGVLSSRSYEYFNNFSCSQELASFFFVCKSLS